MIRHILFWKYTDAVKQEQRQEEALEIIQNSLATMNGQIKGLIHAEIGPNRAGGEYDLVFYAELQDEEALKVFANHPLHVAHRERCKELVTGRLCGDIWS